MAVVCPYCGDEAVLTDSKEVYGRSYGNIWICRPCDAYVGVHNDGKNQPFGRLANKELREWRKKAHAVFDPRWKRHMTGWKGVTKGGKKHASPRTKAYRWLSVQLGIPLEGCHIGEFDVDMCKKVVEICQSVGRGAEIQMED